MKKIPNGVIHTSSAFSIPNSQFYYYRNTNDTPKIGDVIYGSIKKISQHTSLENVEGRIHNIHRNSKAIFVFGNRYAPDYYESFIPGEIGSQIDLVARSGVVGSVSNKNEKINEPTKIKYLGHVYNRGKTRINTLDFSKLTRKKTRKKTKPKMILVVGSSMNSGKTMTAVGCCWSLATMGHKVIGSKIAGTASLKDILKMQDSGANIVYDFTYLGYPSTYMLDQEDLHSIFEKIDSQCNGTHSFWVVEIADGILQRETSILLKSDFLRERIHKFIYATTDAMGAIGGIKILKERFDLTPDALSGIFSSSPLAVREFSEYSQIPVFNNAQLLNAQTSTKPL